MEKNSPHCKLSVIKALVETGKVRTTQSARVGADALGFDFAGMLAVVSALTTRSGKTCTARAQLRGMCI